SSILSRSTTTITPLHTGQSTFAPCYLRSYRLLLVPLITQYNPHSDEVKQTARGVSARHHASLSSRLTRYGMLRRS
ncbi:MAG: hypothetical protein NTU41_06755, partial [Chloroflexi bacterium]|nr:hypothetical protein [Chloroflexota bacterium]